MVRELSGLGGLEQATKLPTMTANDARSTRETFMTLILLEALAALLILVLIVWWTMFSGRTKGERHSQHGDKNGGDTP